MDKVHIVLKDGTELEVPIQDMEIEVCGTVLDIVGADNISALVEGKLVACFTEGHLSTTQLVTLIDRPDGVTLSDEELESLRKTALVIVAGKSYSWMDIQAIYLVSDKEENTFAEEEDPDKKLAHVYALAVEVPADGEAMILVLENRRTKKISVSEFVEEYWRTPSFYFLIVHPNAMVRIGKGYYVLEFKGGVAVVDYERFEFNPELENEEGGWIQFKYIFDVARLIKDLHTTLTQHVSGEVDVFELVNKALKLQELKEKLGSTYDDIVRITPRLSWVMPFVTVQE